jgi:hypothetical protein
MRFISLWDVLPSFSSGGQDSNLRPLAPHASALPGCATTRTSISDLKTLFYKDFYYLIICPLGVQM